MGVAAARAIFAACVMSSIGARCSRRHSPRSSKIVAAESRASDSAISIDDLATSATATRLDAVTADVACRFRSGQRETKLLLHRPPITRARCAAASLLPASSLRCSPLGLTQQCQQALLLGNSLDLWFVAFRRHLGGGRSGRDLAPRCRTRFNARGALERAGIAFVALAGRPANLNGEAATRLGRRRPKRRP